MPGARNFFSPQEQQFLIDTIGKAEQSTSGEIRLHIENFCFGSEVKAAQKVFLKLGMQRTAERNGVLIYIATRSRKVAIVGDEGIHQKLGTSYWEQLVAKLTEKFKASGKTEKAQALADCIIDCGMQLGKFFPLKSDDKDELSNSISF
jgi:uncharacterized membrane protein